MSGQLGRSSQSGSPRSPRAIGGSSSKRRSVSGAQVTRVLATYNIKGGVGKTSAAVNLAWLAARDGFRTLLWDLDPQGASTHLFRVRPKLRGGGRKLVRGKTEVR